MSGAMNRHCIPGLTMSNSPDGELLCECPNNETMHTGFSAYTYLICQRSGADTEETGCCYDLAWKDLCSVLNALSK